MYDTPSSMDDASAWIVVERANTFVSPVRSGAAPRRRRQIGFTLLLVGAVRKGEHGAINARTVGE